MIRRLSVVLVAIVAFAMPSSALAPDAGRRSAAGRSSASSRSTPSRSKTFTVTNVGKKPIAVSVETGFVPDDFSPGQPESTCPLIESTTLAPGQSCTYVVGYYADPAAPFLGDRRIELNVVARAQGQDRSTATDRRRDRHAGAAGGRPRTSARAA